MDLTQTLFGIELSHNVYLCYSEHRSYSTLSVGSTRSSLASELQEIPNAPSIVSTTELPVSSEQLVSEQGEVRALSPGVLEESVQTPVEIKIEGEVIPEASAVEHENVSTVDLEDSEFGSFVSISNTNPTPGTVQTSATEHEQSAADTLPQVNDSSAKPEAMRQMDSSQEQSVSGPHTKVEESLVTSTGHATSSPISATSEQTIPSVLGNNTHTDGHTPSPAKGDKKSKSPVVDRLSLKKNTKAKEKQGKKVSKKESQKKAKKSKAKTEYIDDNQSEMSYQPDTDLSRSKTAKKINGKSLA